MNVAKRGDGIGGGHYSFPFDADDRKVCPFWNEGNPAILDCRHIGDTDFE